MNDRNIPVLFRNVKECYGCSACFAVCPKRAVVMKPDVEGFLYPEIDSEKCVRCGRCLSVCSAKTDNRTDNSQLPQDLEVFAFRHRKLPVRMASRSGGIFTAVSDLWLKNGGVVYGCVLDKNFNAVHIRAVNPKERDRMRGSKYVQSDMKDIFRQVEKDLKSGIRVMFTGTACQTAGLKQFLGKPYEDMLLCIDIVCHGVPGSRLWKSYLAWQEKKHNGRCIDFNFRDKNEFGWKSHIESMVIQKKSGHRTKIYSDIYKMLFMGPVLRPSCYECKFKQLPHISDITIGDFWGIDNISAEFNDNKGVSLVILNTPLGKEVFESIKSQADLIPCNLSESIQPRLISPTALHPKRQQFHKDICNMSFDDIVKKYAHRPLKSRLIMKLRILKHKLRKI